MHDKPTGNSSTFLQMINTESMGPMLDAFVTTFIALSLAKTAEKSLIVVMIFW